LAAPLSDLSQARPELVFNADAGHALYLEHGEYRYQGGFNVVAFVAAGVGAVFSSILPNFGSVLPGWWGVYVWFFGVVIAGVVYLVMPMFMPRPISQAASQAAVELMPSAALGPQAGPPLGGRTS
jgi:hypothetical protein